MRGTASTRRRVLAALTALALNALVAVGTGSPAQAADLIPVTVRITHVVEVEDQDGDGTDGDFYAEVNIDGTGVQTGPRVEDDDFRPDWKFTSTVDRTGPIDINIRLKDFDSFAAGDDDVADISPKDQDVDLNIRYNGFSGRWDVDESDVPGGIAEGDGDHGFPEANDGRKARIEFEIYTGATSDFDGDGVPDSVEINGVRHTDNTYAADLKAMGANPCQRTILMEIDWMQGAADGHNHRPKDGAVAEIQSAFANAPLAAPATCPYQGYTSTGGVQMLIDRSNPITEAPTFTMADLAATRSNPANFDAARRPYFHYAVFAHDQVAGDATSGRCCDQGKDLIVSLGEWQLGSVCVNPGADGVLNTVAQGDDQVSGATITFGPDGVCNTTVHNGAAPPPAVRDDTQGLAVGVGRADNQVGTVRDQSGTLMHELGHSLGLEHGGRDDINNTPNYLSVMNYVFQAGIPNAAAPGRTLDYSSQALPALTENTLNEASVLDPASTFNTIFSGPDGLLYLGRVNGPIDWDQSGTITNSVSVDLNGDSGCISFGMDGTQQSTLGGDDAVVNGVIANGANNTCESTIKGDDQPITSGRSGADVNVVCVGGGANEKNDSTKGGDDLAFTNSIQAGANLRCDSTASGDDIQVVPVGLSEPPTYSGWNDWQRIRFRAVDSPFAAGAGAGHDGDLTFEEAHEVANEVAGRLDPDLSMAKTVDKATAEPGDTLAYTATATNIGTGEAIDLRIVDTMPDGSQQTRTPPASIRPGRAATETFSYKIACGTADGTVLTNRVAVTAKNLQDQPEHNTADNSASASTTVRAPVMTLSQTATATVNAGEAITYTLAWANTGGATAKGVTVTDTVPADVYYSLALDLGAGPRPASVTVNADGTRTLTWNLGDVTAGTSGTIRFTARPTLLALEGTAYTNQASLTFTDRNGCTYPPVTASGQTRITVVKPTGDPLSQGYWAQHPEQWTAEIQARIQATDQRFDADNGGSLSGAESTATFAASGNQPVPLRQQLLGTYYNLATRRVNAGTAISSRTATQAAVSTVRGAVIYATDTLKLSPTTAANKTRYSTATTLLEEINLKKSPVF